MKEKIKKVLLWTLLIVFALAFAGSFMNAVMIILFGSVDENPLMVIFYLVISGYAVIKIQNKLSLSSLFVRNKKKYENEIR